MGLNMIETYLQKLNPRAIEKYYDLPQLTREDVEARFARHLLCCAKCGMGPDRLWLIETIESETKGEGYDRRATKES